MNEITYILNGKTYTCPLQLTLTVMSGKWKGIILWFLFQKKILRFGELKKEINNNVKITDKMLIQCLKELEEDGLIKRKVYKVVPPKVEYSLTDMGLKLEPVINAMEEFGLKMQN